MGSAAPTDLGPGKAPTHLRHRVLGPFRYGIDEMLADDGNGARESSHSGQATLL